MEDTFRHPHHHHQHHHHHHQQRQFYPDHQRYPAPPEFTTPDEPPSSSSPSVFRPEPAPLSPFHYDNLFSRFRTAVLFPLYCSKSELELSDSETTRFHDPHQADDFNFDYKGKEDEEREGGVYYDDDYDDDEVNFVTDLFERGRKGQNSDLSLVLGKHLDEFSDDMDDSEDLNCVMVGKIDGIDGSKEVDLDLGLGSEDPQSSEFETVHSEEPRGFGGLRMVAIDSDSDSEQNENFVFQFASDADNSDGNEGFGGISDFDRPPFCWDYLGFNDQRSSSDNFDWEEADDNEHHAEREIDISGVVTHHDENGFLFDQYENDNDEESREILIHSDTDEDREFRDDLEGVEELEWDTIYMEADEELHELTGNPPAAKSIVESLPVVDLCREVLGENEIICAICKDEVLLDETVRQLPCAHYYHGDCILPWLKIRNTCPVCRYELPTDDPEYEFRKREWIEQNVSDLPQYTEFGYDFHVFCWRNVTRFRGEI